ncbi:sigma factor-like helix-turn-helix DNA-binding protein, partial [Streptomyces sp. 16-176A]|nr:RNA polymerase subunit sigma-70 [Streptomyces sp. SID89]
AHAPLPRARPRPPGTLAGLPPEERLVVVLTLYEGVAEEQTAALLGLPEDRVRVLGDRAVAALARPPARAPADAGAPKPAPS